MQDILQNEVVTTGGGMQAVGAALEGIQFVGLYFGAHWAPCCRRFTTTLTEKYGEINEGGKKFEVVFVSKDGDQPAFDRNFGEMPWKAIKYSDEAQKKNLEQKFGIMEIPMLIILNAQGKQVSDNGIRDLQNHQSNALIEAWEKMEQEAADGGANANAAAAGDQPAIVDGAAAQQ